MNRKMKGLVSGVIVVGVAVALLLGIQGCKKEEPVKPSQPNTPASKPAAQPAPQGKPVTPAPKPAEPNKTSVKDAAGKVVGEAAKGAAAGATTAAGKLAEGATTK